jgi:hypothetical protein
MTERANCSVDVNYGGDEDFSRVDVGPCTLREATYLWNMIRKYAAKISERRDREATRREEKALELEREAKALRGHSD